MAEVTDKAKNEDSSAVAKAKTESDVRPRKLCAYSQRVCNLEILKGFDFCHKHILEDKASPFKPCDFVAKSNGKRCPNPAQKLPDRAKSFCIIHTRKAELRRAVEERRKRRHQDDAEGGYDDEKGKRRRTSSSNSQRSDKLDGHSTDEDGGSGEDYLKVDSAWHGDIDSDADSVDSEEEDFLKHAGVWTVEEATRMCRDKMIRLRSLYITQFKRLQHVLKERRRKYCQAIQAEEVEETGECNLTPTQLLGRKPQHGCPGIEALLHRQAKEKKQGANTRQQGVSNLRCTYSPGGNRCTEKVLPLTKHCMKHITHDPNQLLFQKCTFLSKGESQCERNVPKIFTQSACRLHDELPKTMKRPDVSKDLTDAKERAKLSKARAKDQKESDADISEALQQKSSALVAPDTSGQSVDSGLITAEPQQAAATSPPTTQISNAPSTTPEKMEVDNNDEKIGVDAKELPSNSASGAETSVRISGASGPTPDLASESISPGLAAASLVAVCSSPQVPSQGTPLASVSGAQQSSVTDSKSLPSSSDKDQGVGSCPAERSKADVESKAPDVKPEGDSTDAKEHEKQVSIDRKMTDMCSADTNNTAKFSSQKPASPGKQPAQPKVTSNVVSKPTEGSTQVLASTSSPVSQSSTQGTTQVAPPLGICTPSTSSKTTPQVVTKPPSTEPSEKTAQVVSKSTSQGASSSVLQEPPKGTSRGTSPTGSTIAKQAPSTIAPSSVHPTPSTTTSSSAAQPLKTTGTKPSITSETHRATPIKTFQHLPAGMTAASSKPFRAITSISSKESSKDTKTDPVKPQEPSTSTKV